MDGDAVSDPSQASGGAETAPKSYTEVFIRVFPSFMAMGMTYQQFWYGPAWLTKAYREAYEMRLKNEEWARWRQGAYIYDALLRVAPVLKPFTKGKVEPGKYPEEPWPMTAKEMREQEESQRRRNFEKMLAAMNAESERNKLKELSENGRDREPVHTDQRE